MQKIEEKITWIIDGVDKADEYDKAIDFVHSFGLKCDSVGWSSLKLSDEKSFDLIKKIKAEQK